MERKGEKDEEEGESGGLKWKFQRVNSNCHAGAEEGCGEGMNGVREDDGSENEACCSHSLRKRKIGDEKEDLAGGDGSEDLLEETNGESEDDEEEIKRVRVDGEGDGEAEDIETDEEDEEKEGEAEDIKMDEKDEGKDGAANNKLWEEAWGLDESENKHDSRSAKGECVDDAVAQDSGKAKDKMPKEDIPERMQLVRVPITTEHKKVDIGKEAAWIYDEIFSFGLILDPNPVAQEENKRTLLPAIEKALEFMREEFLEVPFIESYKKGYIGTLKMNDLWEIYRADQRYRRIFNEKIKLLKDFGRIRKHQNELIRSGDELVKHARLVTSEDCARIIGIKSLEQIKDHQLLYHLYYAQDISRIKDAALKKQEIENESRETTAALNSTNVADDITKQVCSEVYDIRSYILKELDVAEADFMENKYPAYRKLGLEALTTQFGLTPEEFAENIRDNKFSHEVLQVTTDPLTACKDYVCPTLPTAEEVLKVAKEMVAHQISLEPLFRQTVREVFFEKVTLSVRPTTRGLEEIVDEWNPVYGMKFLKDKPVQSFNGPDFNGLLSAETSNLVEMKIGEELKTSAGSNCIEDIQKFYRSEGSDSWNEVRRDCIRIAAENLLFPSLRKELRGKISDSAKQAVLNSCCEKLRTWLATAPYKVNFSAEEHEELELYQGLRVFALAYAPDSTCYGCFLNSDGKPLDFIHLRNFGVFRPHSSFEAREKDRLAVTYFLERNKPHMIVVGGECPHALKIQAGLQSIVQELNNQRNSPLISVEIVDTQLAKVRATSSKALEEFPERGLFQRQAISLGRLMQDPLLEYAQLCSSRNEILSLNYHDLQNCVAQDELLERLHLEFVNQVNAVGVDINRALENPAVTNVLQFVCGLGPRTASMILDKLKESNRRLTNRNELMSICGIGPNVFKNCAGFIKIDTNRLGEDATELLDGTRIHPEYYGWAGSMAIDALGQDDNDADPAEAVRQILADPERIKDLDLTGITEGLHDTGMGSQCPTVYKMRDEFINPFKDLRTVREPPDALELLYRLTKETPENFFPGKEVSAQVVGLSYKKLQGERPNAVPVRNPDINLWQCAFCMNDFKTLADAWNHLEVGACPGEALGLRLKLENGLTGSLPIKTLPRSTLSNVGVIVREGKRIDCRVMKIVPERFFVECSADPSETPDLTGEELSERDASRPPKDPYYDYEAEREANEKEANVRLAEIKEL